MSCKDFSTTKRDHELTQTFPGNDPTKAQLLEALRHSQTRAIEAAKVAAPLLLVRQASQLFAYKQWLQLLILQLCYKNQPISTVFPAELPWVPKGMKLKKAEHKVVKQKKNSLNCGADSGRSTTAF
ncbi:hypothetical protein REPUB_Repub07fG0153400 [Reevesia pubescens]